MLAADTRHHLVNVLRLRAGNSIVLFNGTGGEYIAEITAINRENVVVTVGEFSGKIYESGLSITLIQGISRGQKMDYTLQKAVELGVNRIVPVHTEYSNVNLDHDREQRKHSHWNKIIINACEQSGRNIIPELLPSQVMVDWIQTDNNQVKIAFHPGADGCLDQVTGVEGNISILIGPEGGFSESEISMINQCEYFLSRLGPRILRTESAAIAAITACQTLWGDLSH